MWKTHAACLEQRQPQIDYLGTLAHILRSNRTVTYANASLPLWLSPLSHILKHYMNSFLNQLKVRKKEKRGMGWQANLSRSSKDRHLKQQARETKSREKEKETSI